MFRGVSKAEVAGLLCEARDLAEDMASCREDFLDYFGDTSGTFETCVDCGSIFERLFREGAKPLRCDGCRAELFRRQKREVRQAKASPAYTRVAFCEDCGRCFAVRPRATPTYCRPCRPAAELRGVQRRNAARQLR